MHICNIIRKAQIHSKNYDRNAKYDFDLTDKFYIL
jgi:hypothetical protein